MAVSQAALELLIRLKDEASSGLSSITGALGTLGTAGLAVAAAGVAALAAGIAGGVGDAIEARKLYASTEQTIKTMGNAAGRSAQEVVDLASSLSDAAGKSLFGDDQIQASENLLLTFGNIKGETFDLATALTVDLAQALGGAPADQAMMLGKALNDPVKGMSALGKAGLTFTQEQKDMVAAMVESGDMAGAQALIIKELNMQVGGQAAAAAQAAGGWVQFKASLGETFETIGGKLLPVIDQLGAWLTSPDVQGAITTFAENLANGIQVAAEWISGTLIPALQALWAFLQANVVPILIEVVTWLRDTIPPAIEAIAGFVNGTLIPAFSAIVATLQGVIASFQSTGESSDTLGAVLEILGLAWELLSELIALEVQVIGAVVTSVFATIGDFLTEHGDTIAAVLSAAWLVIKTVITFTLGIIKGLITAALAAIKGDWSGAWDAIKGVLSSIWDANTAIISGALSFIQSALSNAWDAIRGAAASAWDGISGAIASKINEVADLMRALPGRLAGVGQAVVDAIWDGIRSRWQELVDWFNNRLQELRDQLPFSEPKDRSSPLFGLGKAGESIVSQIQSGIASADLSIGGVRGGGQGAAVAGLTTVRIVIDAGELKKMIKATIEETLNASGAGALNRLRAGN